MLVVLICAVALFGWAAGIDALHSVIPDLPAMTVSTAVSLSLCAVALGCFSFPGGRTRLRRLSRQSIALTVALFAAALLLAYAMRLAPEIIEFIHGDPSSPQTAIALFLISPAIALLDVHRPWLLVVAQILASAAIGIAALMVLAYVYGAVSIYAISPTIGMAPSTTVAFLLLGLGTLCARPDHGLMGVFTSDTLGGAMARRILPFTILMPIFIGLIRYQGQLTGLYDASFGRAISTLANITITTGVIALNAVQLFKVDLQRRSAEAEARDAAERMNAVLERITDAFYALDRKFRFTYLNPRAAAYFGYAPESLLGCVIWDKFEIAIGTIFEREFRMALAKNQPAHFEARSPSTGRWLEVYVYPSEKGLSVYFHDIDDRKQAEAELKSTSEKLARSNAELEQFAYAASHDLQEPLRGIEGVMTLLHQRYAGRLDSKADEFITHGVTNAQRLRAMIDSLLTLSRVERRGAPLEPVDVGGLLDEVLCLLEPTIRESGARVTKGPLPTVTADGTQLMEVFQNLISNAIKYRRDEPPSVHISASAGKGEWTFSVRDEGIGIEPRHMERIFQPFYRLHTQREYPGTGMGLAICKKIIERHGGRIWVESEPGRGSSFLFTIPEQKK